MFSIHLFLASETNDRALPTDSNARRRGAQRAEQTKHHNGYHHHRDDLLDETEPGVRRLLEFDRHGQLSHWFGVATRGHA